MNEKEVGELRRRFRRDRSSITHIRGCYVSEVGEILSEFNQSLTLMPEDEVETLLGILRKTLGGTLGRNLIDLSFTTQQVMHSEEHKLLSTLRNSKLQDEAAIRALFQRTIAALRLEAPYLILLAQDNYDIPYRAGDGAKQADASADVYSYILCSICPLKLTKSALGYQIQENEFHRKGADWIVSPPEVGFLFPAFDDRSTNLYAALYYTRSVAEHRQEFVDAILSCPLPLPAAQQKERFQAILEESLEEDCSLEVVQSVHDQLCDMMQAHKESQEEAPLLISKQTVKNVLASCGVPQPQTSAFEEKFDEAFGPEADLAPRNLVEPRLQLETPDVKVQVSPDRSDLIETRVLGGKKYILIRADEGIEVNGVAVHIS